MSKTKPASELATGDTILAYGSGAECGFAGEVTERVEANDDKTVTVQTESGKRIRFAAAQSLSVDEEVAF